MKYKVVGRRRTGSGRCVDVEMEKYGRVWGEEVAKTIKVDTFVFTVRLGIGLVNVHIIWHDVFGLWKV